MQSKISKQFVTGVAKTEKKELTLLLDISAVLSVDELKVLKEQSEGNQAL